MRNCVKSLTLVPLDPLHRSIKHAGDKCMGTKELKTYDVSPELFDKILTEYKDWVVQVPNIKDYVKGNRFNASIQYDGIKKMVLRESRLTKKKLPDWYQCICIRDENLEGETYQHSISGGTAWRVLKDKLLNYYTPEEFDQRLHLFEATYDFDKSQVHFMYRTESSDFVYKYTNCVKYDINGAYASALVEIFPLAKQEILKLYAERKDKPLNKKLINYFVGMLCRTGYRKTYNYIVQQIRIKIDKIMNEVGGILLYANTDGFAVSCPDTRIVTSKELGDFKLEHEGDIYIYDGGTCWLMQAGDKLTGTVLYQVRNLIDLSQGNVVKYKRKRTEYTIIAENIETRKLQINEKDCKWLLQTSH